MKRKTLYRFVFSFSLIAMLMAPLCAEAVEITLKGDLNGDLRVDITDVTTMVTAVLDNNDELYYDYDLNADSCLDIVDVTMLITAVLNDEWSNLTFTVGDVTFKMVPVKGGTFYMGSRSDDSDAVAAEKPIHSVTLTNDFAIGQTEVTQALWIAVMGSNPSRFKDDLNQPVEQVSWNNCQTFIAKLNEMTGMEFRLPTEAEWEFAARGGNLSQGFKFSGSDEINDVGWCWDNIPSQSSSSPDYATQPVATKAPNELGIYDMSGNVWEWCEDWYARYSNGAQTDPTGPASGTNRVVRSGGWRNITWGCRVANRSENPPTNMNYMLGLRLAL